MHTPTSSTEHRPRPVMRRRLVGGFLVFVLVLVSMLSGVYIGLIGLKRSGYVNSSIPTYILNSDNTSTTDSSKQTDFALFWQAWNVIDQNFFGTAKDEKRVDGAISGMVASLGDPYTVYLPPSQNNVFQSDLQGNFGGIGAQLEVKNGLLTIVAPLEGTPAQKSGLKAKDVILEIGGKKVAEMSFDDAINAIRGEKGSTVELQIARSGEEKPLTFKLVRDTIVVKSVSTDSLGAEKQFAYIKINQFGQDTSTLLDAALQDAKNQGKKGLILDLRDNPGGYLDSAVSAIGRVIPAKPTSSDSRLTERAAVLERFKDGSETVHKSSTDPILDTLPMMVLVNGGSASASEIFAGAMRDYKRATLVGTKTFGKGSVQELKTLSNGGSVKVTIAKWFTPLGVGIDGKGLEPDVTVTLPDGANPSMDDAQIAKALELLSK